MYNPRFCRQPVYADSHLQHCRQKRRSVRVNQDGWGMIVVGEIVLSGFLFFLLVGFLCPTPLSFGEEQGW